MATTYLQYRKTMGTKGVVKQKQDKKAYVVPGSQPGGYNPSSATHLSLSLFMGAVLLVGCWVRV